MLFTFKLYTVAEHQYLRTLIPSLITLNCMFDFFQLRYCIGKKFLLNSIISHKSPKYNIKGTREQILGWKVLI